MMDNQTNNGRVVVVKYPILATALGTPYTPLGFLTCNCSQCKNIPSRRAYNDCVEILEGKAPLSPYFITSLHEEARSEFIKLLCLRAVGAL